MKSFLHVAIGRLVFVPIWILAFAPADAGDNAAVNALKNTPVSIFTYGLANLHDNFRSTFAGERAAPYTVFTAPLSGRMADDLPLNFHPVAIRASAVFDTPNGAAGATGGNA